MDESLEHLTDAARQLLAIEQLLGGPFVPARQADLPEPEVPDPADRTVGAAPPELAEADKAGVLEAMDRDEVQGCTLCGLCRTRTQTVFGEGDPCAELVFVGEAPGQEEDLSGRPFVGKAGQLLTKMIGAMGLTRERVFICNVLKCRPPNNRPPAPQEVSACWDYLLRQLQTIRPKAIVTLGNPATKALLQTKTGITRLRGTWQRLGPLARGLEDIPVMPTFHPSYVLRQYTPQVRGQVWSDLQQVMALLGLPLPAQG
jgi:DNA polymerase